MVGLIQGDQSLSVRSSIGRRLNIIWFLDRNLVIENLETLFPRSQSIQDKNRFSAAWDAYVSANRVREGLYSELRPYYIHGIDLLVADQDTATPGSEQGLAAHLLSAYLNDLENLESKDSLLRYLYEKDDPEIARQLAWQLWRWGKDNEEVRDEWEKVRRIWEWRIKKADDPEANTAEFQWFVEWLELVHNRTEFSEADQLLRGSLPFIAHNRRSWESFEEYLSMNVSENTGDAIDLYHELIQIGTRPDWVDFNENTETVLAAGVSEEEEIRRKALDIAESYFSRGDEEAEEFLDEHT